MRYLRGLILLIGLLSLSACNFLDFGENEPFTQADLEGFIGAALPAGTTDLYYETEAGIDRIVMARFKIPAKEIMPFVEALGFADTPNAADAFIPTDDWWDGGTAVVGLHGTIDFKWISIVIEDSDAPMRAVYLQVTSM